MSQYQYPHYQPPYLQPQGYGKPPASNQTFIWIIVAIVLGVLLLASALICAGVVFLVYQSNLDSVPTNTKTKTLTSKDGLTSIEVPQHWIPNIASEHQASLSAGDRSSECYVMIISDSKSLFPSVSLDQYADLINKMMSAKTQNPTKMTRSTSRVNGRPSITLKFEATVRSARIGYQVDFVDGAHHFHQVITFTDARWVDRHSPLLDKIRASFRERLPGSVP